MHLLLGIFAVDSGAIEGGNLLIIKEVPFHTVRLSLSPTDGTDMTEIMVKRR